MREIKGWMSEMPIEQTVGVDENEALREKIGDITLDTDQVHTIFLQSCLFHIYRNHILQIRYSCDWLELL